MSRASWCRSCEGRCLAPSGSDPDYRPLCRPCRRQRRLAAGASNSPGGASNGRKRWKTPTSRACRHCATEFLAEHHSQMYCSPDCAYEHYRVAHQERALHRRPRERVGSADECAACNRIYTVERGTQRYCSKVCSSQALGEQKYLRRLRRDERLAVAPFEVFRRVDVFERDDWRCGICRTVVVREAKVPHPLAPTIDHIFPIARGGGHTLANVQCAHFTCNTRKGARVPA